MGGIMRRLLPLFLALLTLSACTTVELSTRPIQDPESNPSRGALLIKALRAEAPEKLASGYVFTVLQRGAMVGAYESSSNDATDIGDLPPGPYQISITGSHINPISVDADVQAGQKTQVKLWVRNARRAATMEDTAEVTGKVLLYTVLFAVYAVVWVAEACVESSLDEAENDRCPRCGQLHCVCRPMDKTAQPPPGPVNKYRK
jgi:hypothetical protein